jgi:hypothetical protein
MEKHFVLMLQYADGSLVVAQGKNNNEIVALPGNEYLLQEMGERLLEKGLITAYQLAIPFGFPVKKES